jgi:hypothetical protein
MKLKIGLSENKIMTFVLNAQMPIIDSLMEIIATNVKKGVTPVLMD